VGIVRNEQAPTAEHEIVSASPTNRNTARTPEKGQAIGIDIIPPQLDALNQAASNRLLESRISQGETSAHVPSASAGTNVQIHLVWISGGTFMMGSPDNEIGRQPEEGPQTQVFIAEGFWLGQFEVTLAQYQAVVGGLPADIPMINRDPDLDRPVVGITWEDANEFCRLVNEKERADGKLPNGYVYRLPTEAEWEYCCRAGTATRFSFGDDLTETMLGSSAWYATNSNTKFHHVGGLAPNAWGLFDMHGNVAEWCLDWLPAYPGGSVTNPIGITFGERHIAEGAIGMQKPRTADVPFAAPPCPWAG
jgi:formylglycine-generating enzyme required for sulfatase activity